jgi:enoyl-CoA hydratase
VLCINRSGRANAYNAEVLHALAAGAESLRDCAVIVLETTGDGAFCSGADRDAMREASPMDALNLLSQRVFTQLARFPGVVIAAIQGPAVAGGFELSLACDLRVASPNASFWLPETSLGIVPAAGGCTRLARLVGLSRAKEVILGGRKVNAAVALEWGLIHRLANDPRHEARLWAAELALRDPVAQAMAKQLLDAEESAASLARERVVEAMLYARRDET